MRRLLSAPILFAAALTTHLVCGEDASRLIRDSAARTPAEERAGFHLPEGFEIQLFADDTQLGGKPVNMAFDARGRLWVTSTQEYPYAVNREKWSADTTRAIGSKDTIRILEDTDGDGRADKITIFADDLNIPTGLQPYKNGCIAWSIPNILFLEDTRAARNDKLQNTNDNELPAPARADRRTILFGPLGFEKDTHGMISSMRLGLDGWIYATHGFSNTSHFAVRAENRKATAKNAENSKQEKASNSNSPSANSAVKSGGQTLDITSGSVFRFKPDGSAVELWTNGQVNPFGLCWDSWGNLYSADCHSSPIYQLIRGAIYPQFGKPADALGFGPVMCEHAHGSTGICGPIYIDGGVWGPEWDDHMFVCNPVTSKVNHDFITFTGSTPKANERPDFLTSDDDWFRPVDLQLGPDSALYIADFYNKIIGHYEVPLDDKRRDRSSGRIWRVVRTGLTGKLTACDLSKRTSEELFACINLFKKGNLTHHLLACNELADRGRVYPPYRPFSNWDTDPHHLRRSVAGYLDNPSLDELEWVPKWFDWLDARDTHLQYAVRVMLKQHLSLPGAFDKLRKAELGPAVKAELNRIAVAVPTADAANWLLEQIKASANSKERDLPSPGAKIPGTGLVPLLGMDRALPTQVFTHIARHLPTKREDELVELVQQHFGDDLDAQLDLYTAVREGRTRKDDTPVVSPTPATDGRSAIVPSVRTWTSTLAQRLVDTLSTQKVPDWQPVTPPTATNPSPWFRAMRPCADGHRRSMLDSHPPGGEKLTGTVRSKTFDLPPQLSFWLAGHRGFPTSPAHEKNFVRLVDADTAHEIALAFPPRHDTARLITWQTGKMPAKHAYLELVDGDDGAGYAWLAVGGFEPEVVNIPDLDSPANDKRIRQAAELAMTWETHEDSSAPIRKYPMPAFPVLVKRLRNLPHHESYSADTRVALAKLDADLFWPAEFPELARDPTLAGAVFDLLDQMTPETADLARTFKTLASPAQVKLASALATNRESATALLKAAPPRVLADPLVTGKLKALGDSKLTKELTQITANLPPQNDALNSLISARLKSYDPAKSDADRGKLVFAQVCVACHRIGVLGNLVGPQLDGIGARGSERLLEDILDPNRAVDPAFRLHMVKLKSGELIAGLLRRDQDDALVLADAAAQEHTVKKANIAADQISEFSLMPSGLGEVLTEQQVHDLLKFLLDRK